MVRRPDFNRCCAERAAVRLDVSAAIAIARSTVRARTLAAQPRQPLPRSPIGLLSARSFLRRLHRQPHRRHPLPHRVNCRSPALLPRVAIGILLIAAILLAVQAQALFSVERWEDRDAGIPYALAAMITFSLVAFLADRWLGKARDITDCPTAPHKTNAPAKIDIVAEIRSGVRAAPVAHGRRHRRSIGLWFITLGNLRSDPPLSDYTLTLIMWLASIVLFVASIISPPPRAHRDWRAWWAQNWPLVAAVSAIGLLALALRVIDLDTIPPTLGGDEGSQGVEALKILRGELVNPFTTSWMSVPTMSFFFNTLTIGPLGHTAFALRLPWALIGTSDGVDHVCVDAAAQGAGDGLDGRRAAGGVSLPHSLFAPGLEPGGRCVLHGGGVLLSVSRVRRRRHVELGDGRHGGRAGAILLRRGALRHDHGGCDRDLLSSSASGCRLSARTGAA